MSSEREDHAAGEAAPPGLADWPRRKNWLFARSEGGAEAAATLYTLIGSCLLQGIDPELYLFDVLGRILDHPASDIGALTPRRWRLTREQVQNNAAAG